MYVDAVSIQQRWIPILASNVICSLAQSGQN